MHQFIIANVLCAMGVPVPQQNFISHLLPLWLSVRGRFNYMNLSRYSFFHERTFRRGFAKDFNWLEFNQRLLTIMIPCGHQIIAALDATHIKKSGKHTPDLGWFFNGCASRVEKGLEASVLSLIDVTANTAYALLARQTPANPKPKTKRRKGRNKKPGSESRLDVYLRHLQEARPFFPALVRHLAVDGFYACRSFVDGACALELEIIGKLRRDASLHHLYNGPQKGRGRPRTRGERVRWANLDLSLWLYEGQLKDGAGLFTAIVYHNSLKRKIKVALLERRTAKGTSRALLFSTDLELSGSEIVRLYGARFQIEFLFRDAKGTMGLNHSQSRNAKAIDFHWNASLCALNLAKWQEERCSLKQRFSAASCRQRNSNRQMLEVFSASLGLDLNTMKSMPAYQGMLNYGVINP